MPQDAHSKFDHAVLDMIEHSPTGAVPATPAYQDALIRLYAAQQVYLSADYKDGHVTARSLSSMPSFRAANIDALLEGQISPEALESNDSIFDRYLGSLPEKQRVKAETFRLTVAGRPAHHRKHGAAEAIHDPVHTLFLVPGTGAHHGLPGNYLYGSVLQLKATADSPWAVHLHDSEDGVAIFDAPTMKDAVTQLMDVIASAPFAMVEIEALGFRLV
ncbi:MAG: hypothetical protein ABIV50_13270 [Opitutus sp.]